MINERMTFRLQHGKEGEAISLLLKMTELGPGNTGIRDVHYRAYSKLTGRINCIVQDFLMKSINEHNPMMYYWKVNEKVQEVYSQFVQLCDTSMREMFNIECETGSINNFKGMFMEQNIFRLRFGKARDSIALWKEILNESNASGGPCLRLMTDVMGESYTLMVEGYYQSMNDIRLKSDFWMGNEKMKSLHQKFIPLCYMAERNYFFVDDDR